MSFDPRRRTLRAIPGGVGSAAGVDPVDRREPVADEKAERVEGISERRDANAAMVERARAGDMAAWARLYQGNFDRVYRQVRYLCGDDNDAEELTQEAFVVALMRLDKFEGRSSFSTWMHAVALNVVRNHWRSHRNTKRAHAKLAQVDALARGGGSTPATELVNQRRERALYVALEALPEKLRIAFVLRDLEGLSPAEASERLGITPGNFAVRAARARTRLRRQLEEMGALDEGGGK